MEGESEAARKTTTRQSTQQNVPMKPDVVKQVATLVKGDAQQEAGGVRGRGEDSAARGLSAGRPRGTMCRVMTNSVWQAPVC